MKKFKIKIKLLVYGFPPIDKDFIIDNFELKSEKINLNSIGEAVDKNPFIPTGYIYNCTFQIKNDKNIYYNYFENVEYIECYISNDKAKSKETITNFFLTSNDIEELINNFKKKLRLIYNLRIMFPIYKVVILNENNEFINYFISYSNFPSKYGIRKDFNKEKFSNNSRYGFNLEKFILTEKNNVKFKRAMSFFNDSFESNDVAIRFILLFSCLESLFITSKKNITENLALCTSRIFYYENKKEEEEMYERIKELYDYRCKYIHGKKTGNITYGLETELRDIVRYVILIYWHLCLLGKTSNKIIKNLKNQEKISLQTKIYIKEIMSNNYEKTRNEIYEMIALEIDKGNVIITEEENGVIKSVKEI